MCYPLGLIADNEKPPKVASEISGNRFRSDAAFENQFHTLSNSHSTAVLCEDSHVTDPCEVYVNLFVLQVFLLETLWFITVV